MGNNFKHDQSTWGSSSGNRPWKCRLTELEILGSNLGLAFPRRGVHNGHVNRSPTLSLQKKKKFKHDLNGHFKIKEIHCKT